MSTLHGRWEAVMMENYGTPPVALVSGRGARVVDDAGNEYLDMVAGIAVNSLGHAHPDLVAALVEQASILGHTSNLAITQPAVRLAERLVALADPSGARGGRVFFCNSGAEANEAAFKLSRLTGRTRVVATEGGFHGRTMGSLALTGQSSKREPFLPLPGDVTFVPFDDAAAIAAAVDDDTAAVIVEPIQGENGVVPCSEGYLAAVADAAASHGALFIVDEVQTGIARTGEWFGFQHHGVRPDVITLAKGLAGGVPIGACIAFADAASLFTPGSHGSTFGGNPFSAAAANAVLDVIERDGLIERVRQLSLRLRSALLAMPRVSAVRGMGLMLGVVLDGEIAKTVEAQAREAGLLVNAPAAHVIRLVPPLVLTDEDEELFVTKFAEVLAGQS